MWYKETIVYELHVRSFADGDGDGVGDFAGLIDRLDYLERLGVGALWLQPFYPSPLRDDGYDIADYRGIHPAYGDLRDFRRLLREAHKRGLRVITELVLNHTSDQHPWFQRARQAKPGSPARDFYVWSDTPEKYRQARIIFKDFENSNWAFDPVAKAYYWHRFYAHQPDLNYDNPAVRQAMLKVVDFWLAMGVDGLRLDAVPYLFERPGTNCENLPETHAFLKELRAHVDERFPGRMLLAEANQWPEDAVAYFGDGDECHMAFHFPVMPRIFMALWSEDRYPAIDIMEQTPAIPESCQWALFLRNHDELTLEMVSDEERDAMYRAYARDAQARINLGIRRRLAPLMQNDRRRMELINILLLSFPGTPILYYGDEIGMGDNYHLGDRNGVRTPMQWSPDRNAGFSRANPQSLFLPVISDPEYHFERVNVETQERNPSSFLWWIRRLLAAYKAEPALGRGDLRFVARLLKAKGRSPRLGFFLHIPFPPADIFLKIPWRRELVDALLDFDLIGFQTLRDRRNFFDVVKRLHPGAVRKGRGEIVTLTLAGETTRLGVFPISIDFAAFADMARGSGVRKAAKAIREAFGGRFLLFGADRLDYTKGVPQRLDALQTALTRFPELRGKVCLIQVLVPSREEVPQYRTMKEDIERMVGEINGRWSQPGWAPVHFVYRNLPHEELVAYYAASDMALVTPLRDGMNLVAKEYAACNVAHNGILCLSEFAGAAMELHRHAVMVNPFDVVGVAEAIRDGAAMDLGQRRRRMRAIRAIIRRHDIFDWVDAFLDAAFSTHLDDFPRQGVGAWADPEGDPEAGQGPPWDTTDHVA